MSEGKNLNPENKCAQLFEESKLERPLHQMFELQAALQKRLGKDITAMSFEDRIKFTKENWICITTEFSELLERLPWKHWKTYNSEQKASFTSEEHRLECQYEVVDILHFFINICLCMEVSADKLVSLYVTKNKENFARQDKGY